MVASASELLHTKLAIPPARADRVPRPRLIQQLSTSFERPLTLICAPAGFGKTSLITDWHEQPDRPPLPLAWLSLDEDDDDPARFLTYLISALETVGSTDGSDLLSSLQASQPPPPKVILTALISRLEGIPLRFALVLDDFHRISAPSVRETLVFLLDHLPSQMRLVITSREDPPLPLSRLRARGQLAEIRANDLRFTPDEAAQFLQQMMGVNLSTEQVKELDARTEGWIAGLQLAALAMKARNDISSFITAFTGSHRFILDYLTDEVLNRQPEQLQNFLLQTSILNRLNGSLCDSVTGRSDSQAVLEQVERGNMFLIALDEDRSWYRYHHLFGDILRRQLQQTIPDRIPELHRRASQWYEVQGLTFEAVGQALAAADFDRVVRLLEHMAQVEGIRGQLDSLLGWLKRLPEVTFLARPSLCTLHASALWFSGQPEAAERRLQDAERAIQGDAPSDQKRAILGRITTIRGGMIRYYPGNLEACIEFSRQALELLPETEVLWRTMARMNAARNYLISGDLRQSTKRYREDVVEPASLLRDQLTLLISLTDLAQLQALQGQLRQAAATYQELAQTLSASGDMPILDGNVAYHFGLGDVLREWNNLDAAEHQLMQGMDLIPEMIVVEPEMVVRGYVALARLQFARGEKILALETLEAFMDLALKRHFPQLLLARGTALRAQFALASGNLEAATDWANATHLSSADFTYPREAEYLTLARVLIARRQPDAQPLLERLLQSAEAGARIASMIEILILQALMYQVTDDLNAASTALERALSLAQPEGYFRVFADEGAAMPSLLREAQKRGIAPTYVVKLLAALDAKDLSATEAPSRQPRIGYDIEALSGRELEVLNLIAEGASNREIAGQLFVTVGTVKRHLNNIFAKLGAQSRTQAVAIAREQNLL